MPLAIEWHTMANTNTFMKTLMILYENFYILQFNATTTPLPPPLADYTAS